MLPAASAIRILLAHQINQHSEMVNVRLGSTGNQHVIVCVPGSNSRKEEKIWMMLYMDEKLRVDFDLVTIYTSIRQPWGRIQLAFS